MSGKLHGSGALFRNQDDVWCVENTVYSSDPRKLSNIECPARQDVGIRIEAFAALPNDVPEHRLFAMAGKKLRMLVDSGATHSVFGADAARKLGLDIDGVCSGRRTRFRLFSGSSRICCQYNLCLLLNDEYQEIEVYWPVEEVDSYGETDGLPMKSFRLVDGEPTRGNLLGMKNVLSNNMLCLTPEKVFVFGIRKSPTVDKKKYVQSSIPIESRDDKGKDERTKSLKQV